MKKSTYKLFRRHFSPSKKEILVHGANPKTSQSEQKEKSLWNKVIEHICRFLNRKLKTFTMKLMKAINATQHKRQAEVKGLDYTQTYLYHWVLKETNLTNNASKMIINFSIESYHLRKKTIKNLSQPTPQILMSVTSRSSAEWIPSYQ